MKYSKISFKSELKLPYKFIGSSIRGALGVGLKRVVCINPSRECEGCFASEGCLFYDFYEKDNPKYRLDLDVGGDVNFDLILFEEYATKAPYVISAVYKVFKEIGITKKRIKGDFELFFNDKLIFKEGEFFEFKNEVLEFEVKDVKNRAYVVFKTPLRIKENNKLLRKGVGLKSVLRSIHHRYQRLKNSPITKLPFEPKYEVSFENFSFLEFDRFSNRQKSKMKLGGLVGVMELKDMDEESYKLLKLGELIGVGKQVSFGFGKIEVL